jgi:hypothetical protein
MKSLIYPALAAGALAISATAMAGEIKGPPPSGNLPDAPSISNGLSRCAFSGLNDSPDGVGGPFPDPGGQVQSYGYFMSQFGIFDPSDPDDRAGFEFPANGCNPHRTGGTR